MTKIIEKMDRWTVRRLGSSYAVYIEGQRNPAKVSATLFRARGFIIKQISAERAA